MGYTEWLATAEGNVGYAGLDNAEGEVKSFGSAEFVAPGLVRPRFFATRYAASGTAIGQLPGKKKGCAVSIYRAPLGRGMQKYLR